MSGLALCLKGRGNYVSGSDLVPNECTVRLERAGIPVFYGHAAENLRDADTVIISCILSLLGKFYMQSLSNYIFGDAVVPPIIKKALDWMNDPGNFEKPIAKLAEENGYSRGHLARLFQQHCKNTMSETFTACKLRYAQNLLKNTEEKIITIANLVGYQTQSQFDVAFKKTYGITPKAFRKQYISSFELDTVL